MPNLGTPLAEASVSTSPMWRWELKIDCMGLFRWYLDGICATHFRGCTRSEAERALQRFAERYLHREVRITEAIERKGSRSEAPPIIRRSATDTA